MNNLYDHFSYLTLFFNHIQNGHSPKSMRCTACFRALPAGAKYVSHCRHVCPAGQCGHATTNACINLVTPCGPGFKLRGLMEEEGSCPGNAAASAATLLRRWSKVGTCKLTSVLKAPGCSARNKTRINSFRRCFQFQLAPLHKVCWGRGGEHD
jgi:hypothetical protein